MRGKAQSGFVAPLEADLAQLRAQLDATRITADNLPPTLHAQWVTSDGRARVSVAPAGDTNNTEVLRTFARAVLAVYPNAIGGPISILESGNTSR